MTATFKVFTIDDGKVAEGAYIDTLHLKGAGIDIPAIFVGEEGRGRERGVVPVDRVPVIPCSDRGNDVYASDVQCSKCGAVLGEERNYRRHHPEKEGEVRGRLMFAEVGKTKTEKPKFFCRDAATSDDKIIVIFRTPIGFRGGNAHTGDRDRVYWSLPYLFGEYDESHRYPTKAAAIEARDAWVAEHGPTSLSHEPKENIVFKKFPGEIVVRGHIAQGDAGRAGGGDQLIALMPKGVVFRTAYFGRLYGAPSSHYYLWNGEKLLAATWDERISADLF